MSDISRKKALYGSVQSHVHAWYKSSDDEWFFAANGRLVLETFKSYTYLWK